MPFRRQRRDDSFFPQTLGSMFHWPEVSWQSFNVDVQETPEGYALHADLPGVAKENIRLRVQDGYLTIQVQQGESRSEETANFIRRERRQMSSQRSFYVGDVKPEDVVASHKDGVLEIKFPKANQKLDQGDISIQ